MKLIVFDLDGTLVNSLADLAAATNISLKKLTKFINSPFLFSSICK